MLFAPGNRRKYLDGLLSSGADIVVADLEDAVPADSDIKCEARRVVADWLADTEGARTTQVFVRINPLGSPWLSADLELAVHDLIAGVIVPKAEDVAGLRQLRLALDSKVNGRGRSRPVLAGIETAKGVANVEAIIEAGDVQALYFGAEDYITDLGGRRTRSGAEVLYARSRVVLAGRLGETPCIDQVVVDYKDDSAMLVECGQARDLGYHGKLCIHPRQVVLANQTFSPSVEEIREARAMVTAAEEATKNGAGIVSLDGKMIDSPLIKRASRLLEQASMEGERYL